MRRLPPTIAVLATLAMLAVPTAASAHLSTVGTVCGVVKSGAPESPGFVRVAKGRVNCHEALKVIRDLQHGHHQSYPLGVGSQPETYVDGWLCNEGHMGLLACWQGNGPNGNPQRMIEWEYLPCQGCRVRTPLQDRTAARGRRHASQSAIGHEATLDYGIAGQLEAVELCAAEAEPTCFTITPEEYEAMLSNGELLPPEEDAEAA